MSAQLDLVAIGRVSVDLYGQQTGSRLEDVATFAKGVGGCPANVAIGAARLGLKSALITRVGDEPMGRFVREQLTREGVDTRGVVVDARRLTSLVLLSVRDADTFPLIFYRENCAGFLHGFLREAPHDVSARFANACGALAVSRLLCSSEFPTLAELTHYLARGSAHRALRHDPRLSHLHRATTRGPRPGTVFALALEDGAQRKPATMRAGTPPAHLERLGRVTVDAVAGVAAGRAGFGVLLHGTHGAAALRHAARCGLWAAGCVQQPGSRPLEFEGEPSLASRLLEWPVDLTVACQAHYHPDDAEWLREAQEHNLLRVAAACRAQGRELLLGIVAGSHGELREDTVARVLTRLYALDIRPDWWELEPQTNAGWQHCVAVIAASDAYCRGILVGLDAADGEQASRLAEAAAVSIVRGFVAGRSMLEGAAAAWLAGQMSDEALTADITGRFHAVVQAWGYVRGAQSERPERSAK